MCDRGVEKMCLYLQSTVVPTFVRLIRVIGQDRHEPLVGLVVPRAPFHSLENHTVVVSGAESFRGGGHLGKRGLRGLLRRCEG